MVAFKHIFQGVYVHINGIKSDAHHAKLVVIMAIHDWLELERKLPIWDVIVGIQD